MSHSSWLVLNRAVKGVKLGVDRSSKSSSVCMINRIGTYLIFLLLNRVVNIAATALVTEAATALFGEAGVTAATGVMTVGDI